MIGFPVVDVRTSQFYFDRPSVRIRQASANRGLPRNRQPDDQIRWR
jgi:hypothetical protein